MGGLIIFISLFFACQADIPVAPPVACGYLPDEMYSCLRISKNIIKPGVSTQCDRAISECEKMTCIFRNSGWLDDDKIDKQKVSDHFTQYAQDNPQWKPAVDVLKINCLSADLPAQGVHLNCPAYDATHCIFTSFIKNASPSQWPLSQACSYPRQFAAACPVCPEACFAPQIPIGSCNACLALPRSP